MNSAFKFLFFSFLAFAFVSCSPKSDTIIIKAGLIDPPGHLDVVATQRYADLVNQQTNGRVKIEVYPASQLGFAMDMLQGLKLGTVEMFVGATTWLGAFDQDFWISGCLYVFNDQEHARQVHEGPIFKEMAEEIRENNGIRLISMNWDRGARNFISRKPLVEFTDLKGLKVRVPEQKSWIANFKIAGANPTPIALSETFTGLQQGIVDATEQASNWLYFNKYHTVVDHLVISEHNYEETGIMISEKFYQALPEDVQAILVSAAKEVAVWHNQQLSQEIAEAEESINAAGVSVISVNKAAWKKEFRTLFPQVAKEVGYSETLSRHIMDEWK